MRDVSPDFLIMGKQALVKKRTTDAPVAFTLHQTHAGTPVTDIVRKIGFSNLERQG